MKPWLSIVGIGEDGLDGLGLAARARLTQASLVYGGARHLALLGRHEGERRAWPSPIEAAMPDILARRGGPVCVLATGDPFFYGVGALLMSHVAAGEMECFPALSAFSLAAARLGWPQQDCGLVSLHGRPLERIIPHLRDGVRVLALAWDGDTPARLAKLLAARGFGASRMVVCEAMGGPRERLREARAQDFALDAVHPLNTIALELVADADARALPLTPGLPDDWFEHDGQITRAKLRTLALAALAPQPGQTLWDIGAGAGSIAIEWALRDPRGRAFAIERDPERVRRIGRNAQALGACDVVVVEGAAPGALAGLPQPDAVFIGGGATRPGVFEAAWGGLRPGGRLVVNAVTLETQSLLATWFGAHGGELSQIALAEAERVGGFHGWRPGMPVVQWGVVKP